MEFVLYCTKINNLTSGSWIINAKSNMILYDLPVLFSTKINTKMLKNK